MHDAIQKVIQQNNVFSHMNQGIRFCSMQSQSEGFYFARALLYEIMGRKSVLYLSGGRTPKRLYEIISDEKKLLVGAAGIIDERYGEPFQEESNEKMIRETGFVTFLEDAGIPFYPMLKSRKSREEIAGAYDMVVREFNSVFQKSIGILGIGSDGHTAGIAPNRAGFENSLFDKSRQNLLVSEFNDKEGYFKERVTMTFLGLSMLDLLILLVFGDDKKEALEKMFQEGAEEEIPARFYKRPDVAKKTLVITDQII